MSVLHFGIISTSSPPMIPLGTTEKLHPDPYVEPAPSLQSSVLRNSPLVATATLSHRSGLHVAVPACA